ncbi:MAG: hypothetical protein ACK415_07955 [Thermodesulfovibrionales bacterium]
MPKKILISLLTFMLFFSVVDYLQGQQEFYKKTQEKLYRKENVKKEEARNEVGRAIFSIGFSAPAIGNDPCQGVEKTMGGMKKYSPKDISLGRLQGKPSVSIGRQGQIMEGESNREEENKEIIKEMDSAMNDFLNNDTQSAEKHLENAREINDERTRRDMEEVKNSENPTKEQLDRLAEDIHTGWVIGRNDDNLDRQAWQEFAKGAVRSSEYPEGRKEWIKNSIYTPNPEIVSCDSPVCEKADELRRRCPGQLDTSKEKKGKIGKQEQIGGKGLDKGMQPSKTYPGEAIKSGYEKEKSSKIDKGGTITNPSESASGRGGRSIDFCGRHLPTPEQAASMGFDPGRITDPVNRDWIGRIEQRGTERTLTWTKIVSTENGSVKAEYSYKEGELVAINYEFYDKKGDKIGYASFDGKNRAVEAKRLR